MFSTVKEIAETIETAAIITGFVLVAVVWYIAKRDSMRKQALRDMPEKMSGDEPLPTVVARVAKPRSAAERRLDAFKFVFLPGRHNRALAMEAMQFVTSPVVTEAENRVAGELGVEPARLAAERRLLLAGAIRAILVEFERRGRLHAAPAIRRMFDQYLVDDFELWAGGDAARLDSAYATYGGSERSKVALAFFRTLRGDQGSDEEMRGFPDFLALFDEYARNIEAFLRPRLAHLAAA
jgi:hypothetical protein